MKKIQGLEQRDDGLFVISVSAFREQLRECLAFLDGGFPLAILHRGEVSAYLVPASPAALEAQSQVIGRHRQELLMRGGDPAAQVGLEIFERLLRGEALPPNVVEALAQVTARVESLARQVFFEELEGLVGVVGESMRVSTKDRATLESVPSVVEGGQKRVRGEKKPRPVA